MERGVRGGSSGRLGPSCLRSDSLGWSGSLALLSAPLLDACPATKICWYLLSRRNKSSIVVRGFYEHKYCPKASDSMSSSLLLMEPLGGSFGRFLPTCCTARCGGTFCTIGVTIGSQCGRTFCTMGVTIGSGLLLLSQGILTLGQALSLLPGLLNADDGRPESLQLSLACQLSSFDGLAPFRIIFLSLPDERLREGVAIFFGSVVTQKMSDRCPDTHSDGFVTMVVAGHPHPTAAEIVGGAASEIMGGDLPSFLSFRSAGGGTWAVASCRMT
ncbi:hypothetical protein AAG906_022040 [Vitis piasezkii]